MRSPRHFRECETCGSPGHGALYCPLRKLDTLQQEAVSVRVTHPEAARRRTELNAMAEARQRAWATTSAQRMRM